MSDIIPLICLFPLIFLAGFIDSIAGGGGLVSLASYYAAGLPGAFVLGNNKFSSTFGTLVSVWTYGKEGKIEWRTAIAAVPFAIAGSCVGAHLTLIYSDRLLSYLLLAALPFLTVLVLVPRRKKDVAGRCSRGVLLILSSLLALLTGLYDGFFGPGTGMFLTLAFSFIGFSMLESAANSKLINLSSNVVALTVFLLNGSVDISLGIPCAVFSIIGNLLGSSIAIRFNSRIIRPMLIVVLVLLYLEVLNVF